MIIVLLGPPGSGKGTQAKMLTAKIGITHISMGDILRDAVAKKTPIGVEAEGYLAAGKLVPDSVTIKITGDRIKQPDCVNGFLLDGFPRTMQQAEALAHLLAEEKRGIDKVVYVSVPLELVVERLTGRLSCPKDGSVYHVKYNPPKIGNKCDVCGGELVSRKDDQKEVISNRFTVYEKQTKPLIDYYRAQGKLFKVDGSRSPEMVFEEIKKLVS